MAAGVVACGKSTTDATTDTTYRLTHSVADPEFILSWDLVVAQCPDIGEYERTEVFVYRGEAIQITNGETFSIGEDSPAAWASTRFVRTAWEGKSFRSFLVQVMFSETTEGLDEWVRMLNFPVQEEGDFLQAVLETETPLQSIQLLLAGKHLAVIVGEFATLDESLFFDKAELMELLSIVRGNISMSEITPLPTDIPDRKAIN